MHQVVRKMSKETRNGPDQAPDTRRSERHPVRRTIAVNDGHPPRGGYLRDMSIGGAAVNYPEGKAFKNELIEVGQALILLLDGEAKIPCRVVRLFDEGYAVEFDWKLGLPGYAGSKNFLV